MHLKSFNYPSRLLGRLLSVEIEDRMPLNILSKMSFRHTSFHVGSSYVKHHVTVNFHSHLYLSHGDQNDVGGPRFALSRMYILSWHTHCRVVIVLVSTGQIEARKTDPEFSLIDQFEFHRSFLVLNWISLYQPVHLQFSTSAIDSISLSPIYFSLKQYI